MSGRRSRIRTGRWRSRSLERYRTPLRYVSKWTVVRPLLAGMLRCVLACVRMVSSVVRMRLRQWRLSMGKFCASKRRTFAPRQGPLQPLLDAEWSLGTITATTAIATRTASIPLGADRWRVLVVNAATGVVAFDNQSMATTINITGLTTLTTYRVYAYWTLNLATVSDASPAKSLTTI